MHESRSSTGQKPETIRLGPGIEIPRIINGLWQLAGGHDKSVEVATAASYMDPLIDAGLHCFDMADHYGDAELVIGRHNTQAATTDNVTIALTKWCPAENGVRTFANAEAAVDLALARLNQRKVALLQYHVWDYTNDTYLHNLSHLSAMRNAGKIQLLGLTNVDTAHVKLLLDSGFPLATNQISASVLDRRIQRPGGLGELCSAKNVHLLCYGTLLGGFLSEKWLGAAEPASNDTNLNWSLRKYLRFIHAAGGWTAFQTVLQSLGDIARRHEVSIAAVASRYVLDLPGVSAVIVGTRLAAGSQQYVARNLQVFGLTLDEQDRAAIARAQEGLREIPGDCGDEYRRPPFLTAAGDLSHHLSNTDRARAVRDAIARGQRVEYDSRSKYEAIAGYSRAVRVGNAIHISGTTANSPLSTLANIGGTSAASQAVWILDCIENALAALGSCMRDVVRTRILLEDLADVEEVSRVHGHRFGCEGIRPANTLVSAHIAGDEMRVEIEAWAEVGSGKQQVLTVVKD